MTSQPNKSSVSEPERSPALVALVALIALSYAVLGRLGLLLAVPPGYASTIFPPSGVALTVMLVYGYRVWPGIWLGSLALNLWLADANFSLTSLEVAIGIATGATLQAALATMLIRRTVATPLALSREIEVLKFMLCGGPLACMVNATIGPCSLLLAGALSKSAYFSNSVTWWIGDTLGVIVVAPLVMTLIAKPRDLWRRRRISVGIPLLTAFATTTSFFIFASRTQQHNIKLQFESKANDLSVAIRKSFDGYIDTVAAIERHITLSPVLDRQTFHDLVTPALSRHPGIYALSFVRRINADKLQAFEQAQPLVGSRPFRTFDIATASKGESLSQRPTYLPVQFIEPPALQERILGLDMGSDPSRLTTLVTAQELGSVVALTGIHLTRDPSAMTSMILSQAVYAAPSLPAALEARRAAVVGFVNCAIRVGDAVQASLLGLKNSGIDFRLRDRSLPFSNQLLFDSSHGESAPPRQDLRSFTSFQVAGRTFELEFLPSPTYDPSATGLSPWAFMVCGLLFCALLSSFLLVVTGRSVLVEELIAERTKALIQAQIKSQAGEERFRSLMQSTPDAIIATDQEGIIVSWNIGAERLFQYSEAEALDQRLGSMIIARDQAAYKAAFIRAASLRTAANMVSPLELSGISRSEEQFPIELSLASWQSEGRPHVTAVIRDISARKEAERVAAEDRSVLASFFANSPQMMAVVDTSADDIWHISANHASANMLGISVEELCSSSAAQRGASAAFLRTWLDEFAKSRLQGKPVTYEFNRSSAQGTRWFQAVLNYIGPSGYDRQRHCYSVFDVTERVNAERKLQGEKVLLERRLNQKSQHVDDAISALLESEANFRFLAESIPQLVWTSGADGIPDFYNKRFYDYTGHKTLEDFKEHAGTLVHPDDRANMTASWNQSVATLVPFDLEMRIRRHDGQYRWHLGRATPLIDAATKTARWFGTDTDIHDQKTKTEELLTARSALHQMQQEQATLAVRESAALESSRLKSEFLASMSHEIRTPINGVIGMTRLLMDTQLNTEQRDFAEAVKRSGDMLLTVINDILDFSKIEAGKLDFEEVSFDLARTLEDARLSIQYMAQKKGLSLGSDIDPQVPHTVIGDPGRLRQIVTNLLSNAVKFTKTGSVTLRAKPVSTTAGRLVLRIEVQDTGIGVDEHAKSRLFKAFSQADSSTTRRFGGTGLGLSISKHLVEQMGGEIGVHSEGGQGATFWFTVVLGMSEELAPPPVSQIPTEPVLIGSRRVRILVAEDVQINQIIALRMLEKFGCSAHAVASGKEAVEALQNFDYDLVFMDCHMPEMDGYEATQVIRASHSVHNSRVPIIAMTANAMKGDREKCLAVGMDDYISKPVQPTALHAIVKKWLNVAAPAAPAEVGPSPSVLQEFDPADLDLLDAMGDSDQDEASIAIEVAAAFVQQLPLSVERLQVADVASSWEALTQAAHSLKSSSASVGLRLLSQSCARLEALTREATQPEATRLELANTLKLCDRAKDFLSADIARRQAAVDLRLQKAG